jgi:hypothetical protein
VRAHVRVRACAHIHTYIYIVSLVSTCPNPFYRKGFRVGHVWDTRELVSHLGREESR